MPVLIHYQWRIYDEASRGATPALFSSLHAVRTLDRCVRQVPGAKMRRQHRTLQEQRLRCDARR